MKISIIKSSVFLTLAAAAFMLVTVSAASAQRDPFKKAGWATPKTVSPKTGGGSPASAPKSPAVSVSYAAPPIEARIEYYKKLRETAATNGAPLPKVTSVLLLNEMAVAGIFKTPRGYAAVVEAMPIKLSYTIYPGEKFFDGQLVAVEENRLVFRKVTKTGEGQFVASVENKPLRQFTMREQAQGTAPANASDDKSKENTAQTQPQNNSASQAQPQSSAPATTPSGAPPVTTAANNGKPGKGAKPVNPFLSPLDEMNSMPPALDKKAQDKNKKPASKAPVKVAKNEGN